MAKQDLTRKQVNRALSLLNKDPDEFPGWMLSPVVYNLGQLEPYEEKWNEIVSQLVREHAATDEDEGGIIEADEDSSSVERQFGVEFEDVDAFVDDMSDKLTETVEVRLRTVDAEKLRDSDRLKELTAQDLEYVDDEGEEIDVDDIDDMAILRHWHFMV